MRRFAQAHLLLTTVIIAIVGCDSHAPLGRMSGTVVYKGQPIREGTIVFEVTGARPATGWIIDGRICEVTTFDLNDGVPVGTAKIAIFALEPAKKIVPINMANPGRGSNPDNDYMGMNRKSLIPARYNDPISSDLVCQVKRGENTLQLDLVD